MRTQADSPASIHSLRQEAERGKQQVERLIAIPSLESHGHSNGSQLSNCLMSPHLRDAPSAHSAAVFDITIHRRLASNVPAQPKALPDQEAVVRFYQKWFSGITLIVNMVQSPSWTKWQQVLAYGYDPMGCDVLVEHSAFVRSTMVSAMCGGPSNIVAGNKTLDWLCSNFIQELCGLESQDIQNQITTLRHSEAKRAQEEGPVVEAGQIIQGGAHSNVQRPTPTSEKFSFLLQQMAGYLVNYLTTLCQNRPRQHRNLARCYRLWAQLGDSLGQLCDEVAQLDADAARMFEHVFAGAQSLVLDIILQDVLLGFRLDLLSDSERSAGYFLACFFAREKRLLLSDMIQHSPPGSMSANLIEDVITLAGALEQISSALNVITAIHFASSIRSTTAEMGMAQFERRYKWLASEANADDLRSLWQRHQNEVHATLDSSKDGALACAHVCACLSACGKAKSQLSPSQTFLASLINQFEEYASVIQPRLDVQQITYRQDACFPLILPRANPSMTL